MSKSIVNRVKKCFHLFEGPYIIGKNIGDNVFGLCKCDYQSKIKESLTFKKIL
jgi:hypothetical protein